MIRKILGRGIRLLVIGFVALSLLGLKIVPPVFLDTEPARISLRNESGSAFSKGDLVAATGFSVPEGRPTVNLADKDLAARRPVIGVVEGTVPNNTNFEATVVGLLTGLDTSSFVVNAQLVLGDDGQISTPPPDTDPFTGEVQLIGSVVRSDVSNGSIYFSLSSTLLPMTAAQFFWTKDVATTGSISGGNVTRAAGLNVDVASGAGFVNDGGTLFRVTWSAASNQLLAANDTNFIFVDSAGVVTDSIVVPDLEANVVLATAITNGVTVVFLANHTVLLPERAAKAHQYTQDVVGPIAVSGITTTINGTNALRLDVDTGTFYTRDFRVTVPATAPIGFTYWHRDGSGGFTKLTGQTVIDASNFDDGSGTLAAIPASNWKKDLLFIAATSAGTVEYHVFYAQETFTTQVGAEGGNVPAADSDVLDNSIQSGGVVIQQGAVAITSVVDVRPFLGQLGPGSTAVTDHGLLSGLGDDDHTQYQLRSEKNAANGYPGLSAGSKITGSQQTYGTTVDTAAEGNDSRIPTQDENDALVGTDGVPSTTNKYVTNSDSRNSDARTPTTHAASHTDGTDDIQNATAAQKGLATATQITKLDGIETGATADQTDAEIKTAYENNANTNEFSDAEQTKLAGIETAATADQTDAEIKTAYENNANTNEFSDAEQTKLAAIDWGPVGREADSGSLEVFSGSPDIESSNWDATDRIGLMKVIGTIALDKGGVVYAFAIPSGVVSLDSVVCRAKFGSVGSGAVTIRVKNDDGTQIGSGNITATALTTVTITTFSPAPSLTAGERIIVEMEGQVDVGEEAFIGDCVIKGSR